MNEITRINSRSQLRELAVRLGVRPDWHEPDEREVTAVVKGESFDNAGFWGSGKYGAGQLTHSPAEEIFVQLRKDGQPVAEINLATLFAFACGTYDG